MPDQSEPLSNQELNALARAVAAVPSTLRGPRLFGLRERAVQSLTTLHADDGTQLLYGAQGVCIEPELADWLAAATPELIGRLVAQARHERGLDADPESDTSAIPSATQAGTERPKSFCYSCASYHERGECTSPIAPDSFFATRESA
jgi:hypothetical protein